MMNIDTRIEQDNNLLSDHDMRCIYIINKYAYRSMKMSVYRHCFENLYRTDRNIFSHINIMMSLPRGFDA